MSNLFISDPIFSPKQKKTMVFCYQNCSDLLWEKVKNLQKKIKVTRTIYRTRAILTRGLYIFYPIFQFGL